MEDIIVYHRFLIKQKDHQESDATWITKDEFRRLNYALLKQYLGFHSRRILFTRGELMNNASEIQSAIHLSQ